MGEEGGGRKAGLRVGLEGFWIWFFSGNGREGYQLSPRDSREGDYRKLTPNLLPMREGGGKSNNEVTRILEVMTYLRGSRLSANSPCQYLRI